MTGYSANVHASWARDEKGIPFFEYITCTWQDDHRHIPEGKLPWPINQSLLASFCMR